MDNAHNKKKGRTAHRCDAIAPASSPLKVRARITAATYITYRARTDIRIKPQIVGSFNERLATKVLLHCSSQFVIVLAHEIPSLLAFPKRSRGSRRQSSLYFANRR